MSIHDMLMVLLGMIIAEVIYITVDYMDYSKARRAFLSKNEAAMKNVVLSHCEGDYNDSDSGQ